MTSKTISEESSKKRKRGRPRIHPADMIRSVLETQAAMTERGAVENLLCASTYVLIFDAWKADPAGAAWAAYYIGKDGTGPLRNKSILAALGRLEDEEDRLTSARIIAERKLPTRYAVATIRRARLGREGEPNFLNLVGSIKTALDAYLAAHPSTPMDMIVRALRELAEARQVDLEN